jgi:hypothetical protein
MHRARRSWKALALRPRLLIALVVVGVGLAAALWLPTRNDTAAAYETGRYGRQTQSGGYRDFGGGGWGYGGDRRHWRDRQSPPPSADPTTPPTSEPPTSAPETTPPTSAPPSAKAWAPFTNYVAGQLVTFDGVEYEVKETHTSLPGWEPPALPNLFKPVV